MYIKDLMKKLIEGKNALIIVYLLINIFFSGALLQILLSVAMSTEQNPFLVYLSGFVLYIVSVAIALSPVGEYIIRIQTNCRALSKKEANFMNPLFREVYNRAKKKNPSIPDDVQLFVNSDDVPNAFATGRKTICVTKGLLKEAEQSPETVKAILAHEFGHIANKDTDFIMLISVGNLIVNGFILGIRVFILIIRVIFSLIGVLIGGREGLVYTLVTSICDLLITFIVSGLMKAWTKLGVWIVMSSSRSNEYEADKFAADLGYGKELCEFLNTIDEPGAKGLFATLESSHPSSDKRIAALEDYGVDGRELNYSEQIYEEVEKKNPQVPFGAMGVASSNVQVPVHKEVPPILVKEPKTESQEEQKKESSGIITCSHCNARIPADSKFCLKCGAEVMLEVKNTCPKCGAEVLQDDFEYCMVCGTKLHA